MEVFVIEEPAFVSTDALLSSTARHAKDQTGMESGGGGGMGDDDDGVDVADVDDGMAETFKILKRQTLNQKMNKP